MEEIWFDARVIKPIDDGYYLVANIYNNDIRNIFYKIVGYANNLSEFNNLDFEGVERSGWFNYDSEIGYYETKVDYWTYIPELTIE